MGIVLFLDNALEKSYGKEVVAVHHGGYAQRFGAVHNETSRDALELRCQIEKVGGKQKLLIACSARVAY